MTTKKVQPQKSRFVDEGTEFITIEPPKNEPQDQPADPKADKAKVNKETKSHGN